ncbi:hypothetical protein DMN91_005165 [Ooceraea biroi]|uniref:Proactivator polypeptide n=1 Tax=Ooceraea biroi TaxID=2015173 RepID=A0A3L8DR53_OOCBI|nr:hypothetical protein DMN91_005165 [Ooceraea biroi]
MRGISIAFSAILAVCTAEVIITASKNDHLLGSNECTWGPSYWCENLKTAKSCSAVKHCIQRYWEQMEVPEDNDNVCGICKDMVQQARDQLESNQTQQELKDVFEGSCKLIHIKPIVKECISLVDEFIPELVDTVASQMNPSVVCTVAGLCNNARIDKLLSQYKETPVKKVKPTPLVLMKNDEVEPDTCTKCYTIANHMESRLRNMPRDKMLEQFLRVCGQLGSYSDSCANIVLRHFDVIYDHLQNNFNADNICHLSGQCSSKYHKHEDDVDTIPKVEITPMSSVGMVEVDDDLPCKLCEQLVGHLKDLLVANTTELEFKQVLLGLCKQTKSFADECKAIVDEYYMEIYEYLTKGLDSNLACQMAGICPSRDKMGQGPIWPLLPVESAKLGLKLMNSKQKKEVEVAIGNKHSTSEAEEMQMPKAEAMQLPIERLVPLPYPLLLQSSAEGVNGKETCALCEYVLHYIQNVVTDPKNEEKVKEALGKICTEIPSIKGTCQEFVDTYGDAVVAILAQEIDPSQVCPMIHVCPSEDLLRLWKTYSVQDESKDKPSCPLCLLAVAQIYNVIRNNNTEANIENELAKLCNRLPHSLTEQCTDFVKVYSKELVEMLLADMTPQEVCSFLKLCDPTRHVGRTENLGPKQYISRKDHEILTNEISDQPLPPTHTESHELGNDEVCTLCEIMMQYIDKAIGKKRSREHIESIVHGMCNHLPKSFSQRCNHFVDEYGDMMITILADEISPKEVCGILGVCTVTTKQIEESIAECALCRDMVSEIDTRLHNRKVFVTIEESVNNACTYIPRTEREKCGKTLEIYGPSLVNMLRAGVHSEEMCDKIALCSPTDNLAILSKGAHVPTSAQEIRECTLGAEYVCTQGKQLIELCKLTKQCEEFARHDETKTE